MAGFVKMIKSGVNLELYEYERIPSQRGRQKGYRVVPKSKDLAGSGSVAFQQVQCVRRKDNARRASVDFKRLVLSNLGSSEKPLLFTFTFAENRTDVQVSARFFKFFIQRMRKFYGAGFRYIAVPEFQKRGAVHYHALFWGLPQGVCEGERKSRQVAKLWGQGFVDVIQTNGHAKISSYLAKYMVKAIFDDRLFGHKAYFASRNVLRSSIVKGIPLWWIEDEYNLINSRLLHISEFMGEWVGKGRYRLYEVDN